MTDLIHLEGERFDIDVDELKARRDEAMDVVLSRADALTTRLIDHAGRVDPRDVADAGFLHEAVLLVRRLRRAILVETTG